MKHIIQALGLIIILFFQSICFSSNVIDMPHLYPGDHQNQDQESFLPHIKPLNPNRLWLMDTSTVYTANDAFWNEYTRSLYTYTPSHKTSTITMQVFNSDSWQASMRTIHTYDASDLNTLIISYNYVDNNWQNISRTEISYTGDQVSLRNHYTWQTNQWILSSQYVYQYQDEQLFRIYVNIVLDNELTAYLVYEYTYNTEGQISQATISYLADVSFQNLRYTYTYNNLGKISHLLVQKEISPSQWANYQQSIYTYDANGEVSELITQEMTTAWTNVYRNLYYYQTRFSMIETIYQYWQDGSWQNTQRYLDEYLFVSNSDEHQAQPNPTLLVAPNPFKDKVSIQSPKTLSPLARISIFNIKGQSINNLSIHSSGIASWDGRDRTGNKVASGIYYLHIKDGNFTSSKKLLKL